MAKQWIPKNVDFTLSKEESEAMLLSDDPEQWLKEYLRKKYALPANAEIDLSELHINPASKPANNSESQ